MGWLTEALVRRGHDVTLFASGDSRTAARLVATSARPLRLAGTGPDAVWEHSVQLGEVFSRASEFDVIHCHVDYLAFPYARGARTPTVHTLHGRLDLPHVRLVLGASPEARLVSISDAQRRPVADLALDWIATAHHGLPLSSIPFRPTPDDYVAFVGRMSPEKRPELAIAVARRLGIRIKLAAKVDAAGEPYFDEVIRPLLDDPLVEFVGEIGDDVKYDFLGGARCLLFPIDWPEPFGLAMIEALACGTPVVARRCGSVPEILRDGETGFIADTLEDLTRAVKRSDLIDREACRADAEARFTDAAMADRYEAIYRRLAG